MKRLVIGLSAIFLSLSAFAQGSIPLLDRVPGHRVQFHYTYSLSQGGRPMTKVTDGDVTVEELLIETVAKEDLFTNPALFINSYKDYMDKIRVNASSSNSLDVTLTLDEGTSARFVLKDITFGDKQGKSDFTMDVKSLPDSFIITDLR